MKKLPVLIIAAVLAVSALAVCIMVVPNDSNSSSKVNESAKVNDILSNNRYSIVTVTAADDFQNVMGPSIYLIAEDFKDTPEFAGTLETVLKIGIPVISVTGPDAFYSGNFTLSRGFSVDDDFVGYYIDPRNGDTSFISIDKLSDAESAETLCEWANDRMDITEGYYKHMESYDPAQTPYFRPKRTV